MKPPPKRKNKRRPGSAPPGRRVAPPGVTLRCKLTMEAAAALDTLSTPRTRGRCISGLVMDAVEEQAWREAHAHLPRAVRERAESEIAEWRAARRGGES